MWETILARTDLNEAVGLAEVRHGGPSVVDHRTLRRSGKLPEAFLRGLGLPNSIVNREKLGYEAESYDDCFISYSKEDNPFVVRFYNDLQACGVRCWLRQKTSNLALKFALLFTKRSRIWIALSWYYQSIQSPVIG